MLTRTKDKEVNGRWYQIGRLDASTGAWLFNRLMQSMLQEMTAMTPEQMERTQALISKAESEDPKAAEPIDPEKATTQSVMSMLQRLSRGDYREMVMLCFEVCSRYEGGADVPSGTVYPVMSVRGEYVDKDLQDDPVGVSALLTQVLVFNLAPFFEAGQRKT